MRTGNNKKNIFKFNSNFEYKNFFNLKTNFINQMHQTNDLIRNFLMPIKKFRISKSFTFRNLKNQIQINLFLFLRTNLNG